MAARIGSRAGGVHRTEQKKAPPHFAAASENVANGDRGGNGFCEQLAAFLMQPTHPTTGIDCHPTRYRLR